MKVPELDTDALLRRIAMFVSDSLAIGSLNRKTGALSASLPCSELWARLFTVMLSDEDSIFPGVGPGEVATVLSHLSVARGAGVQFEQVSLAAGDSRIVFQRCPWDEREVLFVVLPENGGAETNFALFRLVLESVRRDVAIVRAPRVEERCWN